MRSSPKQAGAEVSSVKPGNQTSDLNGVFVVVRKLFSQPALFAARFDVEQHRLDQRQGHAPTATPQVGPAKTECDQARVDGVSHYRIDPTPDELRLCGRL